jgi:hypothetical protein
MQILVIPVTGDTTLVDLPKGDGLRVMQAAVGGYIELIRLAPDLLMYVNEEGLIHNLPFNGRASALLLSMYEISGNPTPIGGHDLRGDVFIIGDDGGPENAPIPDGWIDWLKSVELWP